MNCRFHQQRGLPGGTHELDDGLAWRTGLCRPPLDRLGAPFVENRFRNECRLIRGTTREINKQIFTKIAINPKNLIEGVVRFNPPDVVQTDECDPCDRRSDNRPWAGQINHVGGRRSHAPTLAGLRRNYLGGPSVVATNPKSDPERNCADHNQGETEALQGQTSLLFQSRADVVLDRRIAVIDLLDKSLCLSLLKEQGKQEVMPLTGCRSSNSHLQPVKDLRRPLNPNVSTSHRESPKNWNDIKPLRDGRTALSPTARGPAAFRAVSRGRRRSPWAHARAESRVFLHLGGRRRFERESLPDIAERRVRNGGNSCESASDVPQTRSGRPDEQFRVPRTRAR